MDILLVDTLGFALIGSIVWYFFLSGRHQEAQAVGAEGAQEVHVTVKGGYAPDVIRAKPGLPLRIHFRREETSPCSEEIVFPDFGVKRFLPAFETTLVELPARPAGTYGFACGMDMLHGTLVLGEASPAPPPPAKPVPAVTHRDPICGMSVDPARAAGESVKDGRTFYFCSRGCKQRFDTGGGTREV